MTGRIVEFKQRAREFDKFDDDGQVLRLFGCEYSHEGKSWAFDLWARDILEAEARVEAIRKTLTLSGSMIEVHT